jgi:4-amino-4-deoxy-L-arabinose transferase-like glycosyltransferase
MIDQAKFTDEGWWDSAAVLHHLTGHWTVPGDYNPVVAVPVWPLLLTALFHWTGISIVAARALNVGLSVVSVALVYALVRRQLGPTRCLPAIFAALLLASSPFAFAYSRLAILDTLVVFEFCVGLLVASWTSQRRELSLVVLSAVVTAMFLTKTTALVLVPAIACMALLTAGVTSASLLRVSLAAGVAPATLYLLYRLAIFRLGFGPDYGYFFAVNATDPIEWSGSFTILRHLVTDCMYVDRTLYPAAAGCLIAATVLLRGLWKRPLFVASWVAIAGQLAFLFKISDVYAPRHFLPLLVPIVLIVALSCDELKAQWLHLAYTGLLAIAVTVNTSTIIHFSLHRTYAFYDAARSVRGILAKDSERSRVLLGVSAAQLGLMAEAPSLCDVYGTEPLATKVRRYDPEWLVTWNGIGDDNRAALGAYHLELRASYPVFDDDQRNLLILYRLVRESPK